MTPTLQIQLNEIWNANFKGSIELLKECHRNIADISLPSQRKIQHECIKKKLKPGIDNDYLLLQHVKFITKIDWKNADGFRKLPLVPEDLTSYDVLEDNVGQGKMLGPLVHYSGFL